MPNFVYNTINLPYILVFLKSRIKGLNLKARILVYKENNKKHIKIL